MEKKIRDWKSEEFEPPWWQKRLPFTINVSLMIGSTMFDFGIELPNRRFSNWVSLEMGVFWIHLDIYFRGRS